VTDLCLDMRLPGDDPSDLLGAMFECLASGPSVYLPSNFWTELNRKDLLLLATEGFKNFKRTIAQDYFTWIVGIRDPQFRFLFSHTRPLDWMGILDGAWRRDLSLPLGWRAQTQFAIFSKMLWRYAERHDSEQLLAGIDEPLLGNPFTLYLDGRLISQDLANSCLEYYSIWERFVQPTNRYPTICELGAGYGRTAYCILSVQPACRYFIVDIPPALFVAQRYLSSIFPGRKIFQFRPFRSFAEIKEELGQSDMAFLLPHQARLLPAGSFDLCINISSLHEMRREQIHTYFQMIDHLVSGYFYTKQLKVSFNALDKCTITETEYPVPERWQTVYHRAAAVQRGFFEAMYRIE
jgi:putative sugar O-methyltransferase